jgi:Ca2+/Na+ antiporter
VTRVYRSVFVPLVVIVVLVWMLVSSSSSFSDVLGGVLPFVLLAGFWVFIVAQRRRRTDEPGSQNQVREFPADTAPRAMPAGATLYEKQFGLTLPRLGRKRREDEVLKVESEPADSKEIEKRIGLGN